MHIPGFIGTSLQFSGHASLQKSLSKYEMGNESRIEDLKSCSHNSLHFQLKPQVCADQNMRIRAAMSNKHSTACSHQAPLCFLNPSAIAQNVTEMQSPCNITNNRASAKSYDVAQAVSESRGASQNPPPASLQPAARAGQ